MAFSEQLLTPSRIIRPFGPIGCTQMELNFLKYFSFLSVNNREPEIINCDLHHHGKIDAITAVRKHLVEPTYLITNSANENLEGLVVQDPRSSPPENIVRYFYGSVFFALGADPKLDASIATLGLESPIIPKIALDNLVSVLNLLGLQPGSSFSDNSNDFSVWVKKRHPKFAGIAWPTYLDET